MKFQIDQSGKIEQTNKDTVLAISNGKKFSILLKARDKRLLQDIYRIFFNKQRQFIYEVFSALLYILISNVKPQTRVIFDKEYPGQESLIKLLLLKFYDEQGKTAPANIGFGLVGKTSPAHELSYKVFKKKQKASKITTFEEITEIIFQEKRPGIPVLVEPRALKRRLITAGRKPSRSSKKKISQKERKVKRKMLR